VFDAVLAQILAHHHTTSPLQAYLVSTAYAEHAQVLATHSHTAVHDFSPYSS
jgi:hypothetical protein